MQAREENQSVPVDEWLRKNHTIVESTKSAWNGRVKMKIQVIGRFCRILAEYHQRTQDLSKDQSPGDLKLSPTLEGWFIFFQQSLDDFRWRDGPKSLRPIQQQWLLQVNCLRFWEQGIALLDGGGTGLRNSPIRDKVYSDLGKLLPAMLETSDSNSQSDDDNAIPSDVDLTQNMIMTAIDMFFIQARNHLLTTYKNELKRQCAEYLSEVHMQAFSQDTFCKIREDILTDFRHDLEMQKSSPPAVAPGAMPGNDVEEQAPRTITQYRDKRDLGYYGRGGSNYGPNSPPDSPPPYKGPPTDF